MSLILRRSLDRPLTHDELDNDLVYLDINVWTLQAYDKGMWCYINGANDIAALYVCEVTHNKQIYIGGQFAEVIGGTRIWRPFVGSTEIYFINPLPTTAQFIRSIPEGTMFPTPKTMQEMWDLLLYPEITPTFIVTPSPNIADATDGSTSGLTRQFTITFSGNWSGRTQDWAITGKPDWFELDKLSGIGNDVITVTCQPNVGYPSEVDYREVFLTFTNTDPTVDQDVYRVIMGQLVEYLDVPYFTITPAKQIAQADAGSTVQFYIEFFGDWSGTTQDWSVAESADWISFEALTGIGNAWITGTCTSNIGYATEVGYRETVVNVETKNVLVQTKTRTAIAGQYARVLGTPYFTVTPSLAVANPPSGSTVTFNVQFFGDWGSISQAWVVAEDTSWFTLSTMGSTGAGDIIATCDANIGWRKAYRTGPVTVTLTTNDAIITDKIKNVTVAQNPQPLDAPTFTVKPDERIAPVTGGTVDFNVTFYGDWTGLSKTWTINYEYYEWFTLSKTSGTGDDTFSAICDANVDYNATPRSKSITVCATELTAPNNLDSVLVSQPAQQLTTPDFNVSPTSYEFAAAGGSFTFTISYTGDWTTQSKAWTLYPPNGSWFTVTPVAGNGTSVVTFAVTTTANTSWFAVPHGPETISITVLSLSRTKTVTITQKASPAQEPYIAVSPSSYTKLAASGSVVYTVQCLGDWGAIAKDWMATCVSTWATPAIINSTGNANFTINYTANTGGQRTQAITVSTKNLVANGFASEKQVTVYLIQEAPVIPPPTFYWGRFYKTSNYTVLTEAEIKNTYYFQSAQQNAWPAYPFGYVTFPNIMSQLTPTKNYAGYLYFIYPDNLPKIKSIINLAGGPLAMMDSTSNGWVSNGSSQQMSYNNSVTIDGVVYKQYRSGTSLSGEIVTGVNM